MKNTATKIVKKLQDYGFQAVFAGGCVRDCLLNIEPKDYDIATSATPDEVESIFDRTLPLGKSFGVIKVFEDGYEFEIATFRKDSNETDGRRPKKVEFSSMEEDAQRRDFTINGMFLDPVRDELIDYVNGKDDLSNKILRFIGNSEDRINEDKLRMLRACRFASVFNLEIEEESFYAILRNSYKIDEISIERVQQEIRKAFSAGKNASKFIKYLFHTNLLIYLMPEVDILARCEQDSIHHPEGSVFNHICLALDNQDSGDYIVCMAILLHDVGKPSTFRIINNKITAYGHDKISAEIAKKTLTRLKFSNDDIERICWLVEKHMFFRNENISNAKLRRIISNKDFDKLKILMKADILASNKDLSSLDRLEKRISSLPKERELPKRLINGYDLLGLGYKEGKEMGKILSEVYELQLNNILTTKESQLDYVKNTCSSK